MQIHPLVALAIWISLAPLNTPRQELAVTALNGKVYAIGGLSGTTGIASVEEYDPRTNRWRLVAPLPVSVHHEAAVTLNEIIYVIGGYRSNSFNGTSDVYRYDATLDLWTRVADLPSPRGAHAAAVIDGRIYAVGGVPTFNDLVSYDPASDTWTSLAPMPTAREHLAAVAFDGKLFVAGGRAGRNIDAFEMYDPQTDRWTVLPSLPTARSGLAAAIAGGRIYVFGGEGNPNSATGVFAENESYDVATQTWRKELPMPIPRHGIGAATVGEVVYIPGGGIRAGFGVTDAHQAFAIFPPRRRAVRQFSPPSGPGH